MQVRQYRKVEPYIVPPRLANSLQSGAVSKVNDSKMAFKLMENISFFLGFAEKHVSKTELFQVVTRL